eukprot:c13606_g1_i1 orf=1-225(-)
MILVICQLFDIKNTRTLFNKKEKTQEHTQCTTIQNRASAYPSSIKLSHYDATQLTHSHNSLTLLVPPPPATINFK